MKNFRYIVKSTLLFSFVALLAGCGDSFLDKEPSGGYVSGDQLELNATWNGNIMLGQSYGITSTSLAQGTGGTTGHDDFGQKSVDIATDIISGDMAMSSETYGWFSADAKLNSNTTTRNRAYMLWRYYYQVIKSTNSIFDVVGGDEKAPESGDNRIYFGQAKAMRAHAYFSLVNLYNKPYKYSKTDKALPIYRTQLLAENVGLSTVQQVYDLIVGDLKTAIECLEGFENPVYAGTPIKSEINQATAKGILAYVYLTMGNNTEAAKLAMEVINTGEYPILTYDNLLTNGFNSVSSTNWLWAIDLTTDNSPALPTFWGHVDYFTYSYCSAGDFKMIDYNLYTQIPTTDKRKSWFNSGAFISWYKFYNAGRVPMGDRQWIDDEVLMRIEEMYLIAAEAYARENDSNAKIVLKAFLDQRDPTVAETLEDLSQSDLLDLIYYNWRVEMWAEGKGLLTMKRFEKSMTRGNNNFALAGQTIKWDDSRLYFEIPQNEILNNPLLDIK